MTTLDWHDDGLCAQTDPEAFFPEHGTNPHAKQVCDGCPVKNLCLQDAMEEEAGRGVDYRFGIRGGLGPRQRYRLAKKRASA
ncbi:WhiB family transcriptional regulator [Streptomyces sp. ISL-98]|uniref:WhiB family transcriptional regulator n=1 Tax=Streptomyces sp. ISL-98 TaxID=2819192 RepID=UPI0027E42227|nr:WhiB family transcriptional regulator [Streptomyces sp. ISL-98]